MRLGDHLAAEIDGAAILGGEHEHAHVLGVKLLENIAHGEEIAQGLGHFFVVHVDEAVVHPVMHIGLAGCALALRYLVFMVGEEQILAAAVNIEGFAQVFHAHGAALNVPAGTAHAPGAGPGRLAGLLRLPYGKIGGVLLGAVHFDACAGFQIFQVLARQAAVAGEGGGIKVHVAVYLIGQPLVHQPLHQRDDLGNMLGGAGMHGGGTDAQRLRVLIILGDKAIAQLLDGDAFFIGAADHLIVDIGEILHKRNLVAAMLQIPAQHVEHDKGTGVADMKIIVYRRAAGIDARFARMNGHKLFLAAGFAVVNLHKIGSSFKL